MTDQQPAPRAPRAGRHWLLAATAMPASPLLLWTGLRQTNAWHVCVAHHPSPATPTQGPCAATYTWMALATLAFWALALAATATGLALGIMQGRHRRRFAHRRWINAGVVGICAPWALLAYGLGYGAGRLLPMPRPRRSHQAYRDRGWQQAVQLYAALAHGQPPSTVLAPDFTGGAVYMDVPFTYSRCFAMNVTYQPGGMFAIGSPGFVAGAAIGRLIGTSIGHARAANLSRRQWRGHRPARVVVTATSTWCQVGGRWLRFDHHAALDYQMVGAQGCTIAFDNIVPLRLDGPSAWCHAVLFAYLRYGAAWQTAPHLRPIRHAAQQMAAVQR